MDPDEAFLSFLRGGDYLRGLHVSGMFDLCRALKRHGLLPAMAGRIEREMPKAVYRIQSGEGGASWKRERKNASHRGGASNLNGG